MIRAGFPTTVAPSGTSFVTTLPAPTNAFVPIVIPPNIVALDPIDAPVFTTTGKSFQFLFTAFCILG